MNSRASGIAIYLRTYFYGRVLPLMFARSAGCIAATDFVLTAVILNDSEASGPLANGRVLKMYS